MEEKERVGPPPPGRPGRPGHAGGTLPARSATPHPAACPACRGGGRSAGRVRGRTGPDRTSRRALSLPRHQHQPPAGGRRGGAAGSDRGVAARRPPVAREACVCPRHRGPRPPRPPWPRAQPGPCRAELCHRRGAPPHRVLRQGCLRPPPPGRAGISHLVPADRTLAKDPRIKPCQGCPGRTAAYRLTQCHHITYHLARAARAAGTCLAPPRGAGRTGPVRCFPPPPSR